MFVIGDIGNTETKICVYNNSRIIKRILLKSKSLNKKIILEKFKFLNKIEFKSCIILFSSVVPNSYSKIKYCIEKKYKKKCLELKNLNLNKFIKINVNRKQIGSDRLANAISVSNNLKNYIILDFGTATTFDVVIKNKYIGGIIAPGVELSLKTLISKASLIPSLNLSKVSNVIGKNTKTAVRSGFFWGYQGLIESIIRLIIKQTRKKFKIIITGGLSHLYKNSIKGNKKINKDLTIQGLLKVAKNLK